MRASLVIAALIAGPSVLGQSATAVQLLPTPAATDSGMYSLTAGGDGRAYLAWLEPVASGGHALRFSRFERDGWSEARTIDTSPNWFVNWADHPSLTATPDGRLFAHWLINTGAKRGAYGYAIHARTSTDAGRTWTPIFDEGVKNIADYSGFLTFLPGSAETIGVYLTPLHPDDSASGHDEDHIKTVGIARFGADGRAIDRAIVDADACSCCSTDVAMTADGPIAVYRDHGAGEIRDIAIVRRVGGRWTAPAPVHRDSWHIDACPTNGPAVAATGRRVAVTWFTAAEGRARVLAAFSNDSGATFSTPVRIDEGTPAGWPDVVMTDDGRTFVSWLEKTATNGVGEVRVREVAAAGAGPAHLVATASSGRATGIPMLVRQGADLLIAWRDGAVKTARLPIPAAVTAWR